MATYTFAALGFDPAPGDPDAVEHLARECDHARRDLQNGAAELAGLGDPGIWQGEASDGFKARSDQVRSDLAVSGAACESVAVTLLDYANALRDAQIQARRAEDEAADAKGRMQRFSAGIEQLVTSPAGVVGAGADVAEAVHAAQRQLGWAEEEYQAALRRAREIRDWVTDAGDAAARRIRGIEAPYHRPRRNLFQRAAGWVGETVEGAASAVDRFVDEHAELLCEISGALKAVSGIAGLLSFVPVLTPIMAPIATATAGTALALDATLVAAGDGSWQQVAVDGALMALPGAGRLASRAVVGRQAERLVATHLDEVAALNLSNRARPGTVAALRTRNVRVSEFRGASKAPRVELHPDLRAALDRVPVLERSKFHGKCAEINAIDTALKGGARLEDSVVQTRRLRHVGDPAHGTPHPPCDSCSAVLRNLGIKYME